MRNDEAFITIQPDDNSSDEFFIRIPAKMLKMAGMRPGEKVVLSVEPSRWNSPDTPTEWRLEISKIGEE